MVCFCATSYFTYKLITSWEKDKDLYTIAFQVVLICICLIYMSYLLNYQEVLRGFYAEGDMRYKGYLIELWDILVATITINMVYGKK